MTDEKKSQKINYNLPEACQVLSNVEKFDFYAVLQCFYDLDPC